jgi:hypothetical protein
MGRSFPGLGSRGHVVVHRDALNRGFADVEKHAAHNRLGYDVLAK